MDQERDGMMFVRSFNGVRRGVSASATDPKSPWVQVRLGSPPEGTDVDSPLRLSRLGVEGSEVFRRAGGNAERGILIYGSPDHWEGRLRGLLSRQAFEVGMWPGSFGEDITVSRPDLEQMRVGDVWEVGQAQLVITGIKPAAELAADAAKATGWPQHVLDSAARGAPPAVLARVDREGEVRAVDYLRLRQRGEGSSLAELARGGNRSADAPTAGGSCLSRVPGATRPLPPGTVVPPSGSPSYGGRPAAAARDAGNSP